ncbi:hypothetical protein [Prevotella ihumii]|uniref:hypothetical protein n=1 Tax=Prevotella ihumii TaxID=1917878 RepID=UPI000981CEEB|nr:hypothetical protein [Prevotella ihumii]
MKKYIYKAFAVAALFAMGVNANAQKLHVVSGLETTHLWRGLEVSKGLTLDNEVAISDNNNHFRFGLWGGMQIAGNYKEFDYYVSYTNGGFSASLWDIYNFSDGIYANDRAYKIFNYDCHDTGHFLDATIAYNFGEKFPLNLSWSTVIAGRDRGALNQQNLYSTFVQASYKAYEDDNFVVTPSIGGNFALNPEDGSHATFYGKSAGINDVRLNVTYKLKIGNHPLPVTATAMWNPEANKGYFCASVNLLNL